MKLLVTWMHCKHYSEPFHKYEYIIKQTQLNPMISYKEKKNDINWNLSDAVCISGANLVLCVFASLLTCVPLLLSVGDHWPGGAADHVNPGERWAEPAELLLVQAAGWGLWWAGRPAAAQPGCGQAASGGGWPRDAPEQPETGTWLLVKMKLHTQTHSHICETHVCYWMKTNSFISKKAPHRTFKWIVNILIWFCKQCFY